MKKSILIILLLTLLILPSVLAVEFDVKEQYAQGETLIAKVSGTFISPITTDNIFFYREHTRIPIEFDVNGANGEYYIYALLENKNAGNYSISIENAQYKKGAETINEPITKNFSITDKTADFSINPGFVFPTGGFSIDIQNLKDNQIIIDVNTNLNDSTSREIFISSPEVSDAASISLISGQEKQINFKLSPGPAALKKITMQTNNTFYEIPISLLTASEGNQEATFSLEPSKFTYSLPTNSQVKKTVYIYNTGNTEMKNISILLSDSLKSFANVSVSKIDKLDAGSNTQFELIFSSKTEGEVEGDLKAIAGETIAYSSISLKFLNNYVAPANETVVGQSSQKTCAELQGISCNKEGFKCSKEMIDAKDGWCCKGTCDSTATSSVGKIIAIVIVVVIVAGLIWFYLKKYKKAKKPVDLLEVAKGKEPVKL
jgi:hypothetical protein